MTTEVARVKASGLGALTKYAYSKIDKHGHEILEAAFPAACSPILPEVTLAIWTPWSPGAIRTVAISVGL